MPEISKLTRRKGGGGHSGGGHSGGGHSGDGHSSGGKKGSAGHGSPPIGSKSGKSKPKVSQVDGLPKGHNKATTYGRGGGAPVDVKSGPFTGWRFGGETRSRVYGSRWVFYMSCLRATSELIVQRSGFTYIALGIHTYRGSS